MIRGGGPRESADDDHDRDQDDHDDDDENVAIFERNAYCNGALSAARQQVVVMNAVSLYFSPSERKQEKQASREADSVAVLSGAISPRGLSMRNNFFGALDVKSFRIGAIGSRSARS
jgi:hypothetical protein